MMRALMVTVGLIGMAALPLPCHAQWGWPPPGYSTSGVRACDNSLYRGLRARWRERHFAKKGGCATEPAIPVESAAHGLPEQAAESLPPPASRQRDLSD
jgi:hypothetical protein